MITDIKIKFLDPATIGIYSLSTSAQTITIFNYLPTGVWSLHDTINLASASSISTSLPDGVYKVVAYSGSQAVTIIIYADVLAKLNSTLALINKQSANALLKLGNPPVAANLTKYDFISLVLLGILFLGNSVYQNTDYTSTVDLDAELLQIANAIINSNNYTDIYNNTPQSILL